MCDSHILSEYCVLVVLCLYTFVNYIVRAVRVINAFCDFLGIRCLVIPTTKPTDRTLVPKSTAEQETDSLLVAQEEGSNQSHYNTF
jgi:ethanolaminephosphotransferase